MYIFGYNSIEICQHNNAEICKSRTQKHARCLGLLTQVCLSRWIACKLFAAVGRLASEQHATEDANLRNPQLPKSLESQWALSGLYGNWRETMNCLMPENVRPCLKTIYRDIFPISDILQLCEELGWKLAKS